MVAACTRDVAGSIEPRRVQRREGRRPAEIGGSAWPLALECEARAAANVPDSNPTHAQSIPPGDGGRLARSVLIE